VSRDPEADVAILQRIDDWQRPRLPALLRAVNALSDGAARRAIPLGEASLLAAARRRTGLRVFGDGIREPLALLLEDLESDAHLTPFGRLTARSILGQILRAHLRVEDALARRPAVAGLPVHAPIVIVGLPRTGTTHLHHLLAQVPALRSLPFWESIAPLPGRLAAWGLPDARRLRARLRLRQIDAMLPLFRAMHAMAVDLPHEELQLSALTFRSFFFEGAFRLPHYRRWYAAGDHREAYRYLRRVLQLLQSLRGGERWVLKSPQHLDQLDALAAAFPDLRIVRTHRDPARAVLSLATMITYTRRVCYRNLDPAAEARGWVERAEQLLRRSQQQAERLARERVLDVSFDALRADPVGTVERVLAFAELPLDTAARRAVDAYLARHRPARSGRVDYRFEDLGLDRAALDERFRFASARRAPPQAEERRRTATRGMRIP
jgi:hypothetical protein